ncbi:MAG: hypothetical protein WBD20_13915 [Pirellulaceae bacterium]
MDELRFKQRRIINRSVRRLAILAAINCTLLGTASTWCLADGHPVEQSSRQDLRSLLSDGWTPEDSDSLSSQVPIFEAQVKVAPVPVDVVESMVQGDAPKLSTAEIGLRLKPIQIESATEISGFVDSKPTSNLNYADLPARTVSTKSAKRTSVSASDDLPKLPPPTKQPSRVSAFTMPDLQTSQNVSKQYSAELKSNHNSTSNEQESVSSSSSDLSLESAQLDALRSIASQQGFGLMGQTKQPAAATRAVPTPVSISKDNVSHTEPQGALELLGQPTIHSSKLGEIAAMQLGEARSRLRRGATHSAKRLTIQSLQNIAAMQDLQQGGNQNAKHLDAALVAIRESEDFNGKFGTVDQRSLQRLVIAHKTSVLKNRDLRSVSPMRATEAYLAVAREEIVMATASVGLASDALVLLGRIESSMAKASDPRSGAVALSLQQAAVEVDPANSHAWLELGTTMLNEGMALEAVEMLDRSVELQPSRNGYGRLMAAAQQAQDAATVHRCIVALQNPRMQNQIPVRQIDQESFAAMYTPTNSIARNAQPTSGSSASVSKQTDAQPVSSKEKRFGLLRSWVMPKSRR